MALSDSVSPCGHAVKRRDFTRLLGSVTDLAVVAALSRCTPGPRGEFAGCGIATGILALLRGKQREITGSTFRDL